MMSYWFSSPSSGIKKKLFAELLSPAGRNRLKCHNMCPPHSTLLNNFMISIGNYFKRFEYS